MAISSIPRSFNVPNWKLATLYEGTLRHPCGRAGHASTPCRKCRLSFLHDNRRFTATYAEIVFARDEELLSKNRTS